jgi:transposase-like protein
MRLLSPDSPEPGAPAPETPPAAPPAPPAPPPEAPPVVARTNTDRTPRERELETRLAELEDERDNLKRALYEPKPARLEASRPGKPRPIFADVERELTGKG